MSGPILEMILLTMFLSTTFDPKTMEYIAAAAQKKHSCAHLPSTQEFLKVATLWPKNQSKSLHSASAIQQCNVSIEDVRVKSLEFSKLLLQKMTQFVVVSVRKESSEGQSALATYSKMVWVNNAVGMTVFSIISRRPEIFSKLASLWTLTAGKKSFEIDINQDPEGCLKNNETKETEILQNITAILGKKAINTNKVHCQLATWNEDRIHVCCRRNTSALNDNCLSPKAFEFLEGNHDLDYVIMTFCYILCAIALARASAFLENRTERHLKVPQNFILREILGKVCYKSIVPKFVLFVFFFWWAFLKYYEDEAWFPILVTFFIFVVLLLSIFHPNFESDVDTYPGVHNTNFGPYPGFSYFDTNLQTYHSWYDLGSFGRVYGTYFIIIGASLPSLFFIRVLKYILLGLLFNHDHYLPRITLYFIAASYISKWIQSACESYSSLLINVFNYLETQEAVNESYKYENGNFLIRTDAYEKVRRYVMPYGQKIFYLLVQVIFIILFSVVVLKGLNYAEDNTEFSVQTKVVALFAVSTLPYILKICSWEQSDKEKEILVKAQSKRIKKILGNIRETLQENQNEEFTSIPMIENFI